MFSSPPKTWRDVGRSIMFRLAVYVAVRVAISQIDRRLAVK